MKRRCNRARDRGLALLCAMLLLLATMIVGLAVTRATFASVAASRFERERMVARGAAEAALFDAERDIAAAMVPPSTPLSARAALFTAAGAAAWPAACGHGETDRGLCALQTPSAWQALDLAAPDNPALAEYGAATGAAMATGGGLLPARLPAYVIERLAAPNATSGGLYRITAIGFGSRVAGIVVLQALYRTLDPPPAGASASTPASAPASTPATTLPFGRIGGREIANWPELHAGAKP